MDFRKDYYAILELQETATKLDIKAAYRRLAKIHHPDKNPGNPAADELFKDINLANEVLSNDIIRAAYDQYRQNKKILQEQEVAAATSNAATTVRGSNKRQYKRTTKVKTEKRIYIYGEIIIKYWAEEKIVPGTYESWRKDFKIFPTEVKIFILESDIHNYPGSPVNFQKAYSSADLFKVPLPQPIKCIVKIGGEEEHYDLNLADIRIKDPRITNVTPHDNMNLATLQGFVYAYTLEESEKEIEETVEECFGETGNTEQRAENGHTYIRKEYFNADATRYWGQWEKQPVYKERQTGNYKKNARGMLASNDGCGQWSGFIPLIILACALPRLTVGILGFLLLIWILNLVIGLLGSLRGVFTLFSVVFVGLLLYAVFFSTHSMRSSVNYTPRKAYDTLYTDNKKLSAANGTVADELITHHIKWADYDHHVYETSLSILRSQVNEASNAHEQLSIQPGNSLAPVYQQLMMQDDAKLQKIYHVFDSIKTSAHLGAVQLATMMVSCIQSIPYYLVLDQSCDAKKYQNAFIVDFLNQCSGDCCVGYAKYGVRSPAEFIGDLKGDCDTRALIIYTLLKKFDYNVALLTSRYYQHALVAVDFNSPYENARVAIPIHNKLYYLWETTQAGMTPGDIPIAYRDIQRWNVDLLNEKKNR
jgi:hypothetical protein